MRSHSIVATNWSIRSFSWFINQIHGLGLAVAHVVSEAFYWDLDEQTRTFSRAFEALAKKKPSMIQAGVYSAVTHYLTALQAGQSDDALPVAAKMRELPVNDFMRKDVRIREDGRVMRNMYLFEDKSPSESKGLWDCYKLVAVLRGEDAFRPLDLRPRQARLSRASSARAANAACVRSRPPARRRILAPARPRAGTIE